MSAPHDILTRRRLNRATWRGRCCCGENAAPSSRRWSGSRVCGPGTATTVPRSLEPPAGIPSRRPAPGVARPDGGPRHADARYVAPAQRGRLRLAPHDLAADADAITLHCWAHALQVWRTAGGFGRLAFRASKNWLGTPVCDSAGKFKALVYPMRRMQKPSLVVKQGQPRSQRLEHRFDPLQP